MVRRIESRSLEKFAHREQSGGCLVQLNGAGRFVMSAAVSIHRILPSVYGPVSVGAAENLTRPSVCAASTGAVNCGLWYV